MTAAAVPDTDSWRDNAACRGADTALWFHDQDHTTAGGTCAQCAAAIRICAGCPVRTDCLAHALAADETYGIWGGQTAEKRDRELAKIHRLRRDTATRS